MRLAINQGETTLFGTYEYIKHDFVSILKVFVAAYLLRYIVNDYFLTQLFIYTMILLFPLGFLYLAVYFLLIEFFNLFFVYFPIYSHIFFGTNNFDSIYSSFSLFRYKPHRLILFIIGVILITQILTVSLYLYNLLIDHQIFSYKIVFFDGILVKAFCESLKILWLSPMQACIFLYFHCNSVVNDKDFRMLRN